MFCCLAKSTTKPGPLLEMLNLVFHIMAVHQPFYIFRFLISTLFSVLPTHDNAYFEFIGIQDGSNYCLLNR